MSAPTQRRSVEMTVQYGILVLCAVGGCAILILAFVDKYRNGKAHADNDLLWVGCTILLGAGQAYIATLVLRLIAHPRQAPSSEQGEQTA